MTHETKAARAATDDGVSGADQAGAVSVADGVRVAMEFGMWRWEWSGRSSGSVTCGNARLRAAPGAGRS